MHNCGSDDLANRMDAEMPLPLVSIVTPSYNQGRFLRRAIDSVLSQDYPHLEYFVLDGGSTDESADILRSYSIVPSASGKGAAQSPTSPFGKGAAQSLPSPSGRGDEGERKSFFWLCQPDRGQTDAINQGLRRTRGDILAYLNSDDVLLPGAIAAIVQHFRSNPDWDLLYGNAYHIDENDCVLGTYPTAPYEFDRLLQSCCICQPAAAHHRPRRPLRRVAALCDGLRILDAHRPRWRQARARAGISRLFAAICPNENAVGSYASLSRDSRSQPAPCR